MVASTRVTARIRNALREIIDPEVGMNILDLGLIYGIECAGGRIQITMTMTTPACPLGSYLKDSVRDVLQRVVPEAADIRVDLVWNPPWSPEMMSESGKSYFGWTKT